MKAFGILLALVAAKAVFSTDIGRGCNTDSCLSEVKGTAPYLTPALTSRLSDCSNFQTKTYTRPALKVTITKTKTVILGDYYPQSQTNALIEIRGVQLLKGKVPAYATHCLSPKCFASACSCAGITAGKTTVPGPTKTIYNYTTITVCPDKHKTLCVKNCYDTENDKQHCGSCDKKCGYGENCQQGHCKTVAPVCKYDQKLCYGQCKNVQSDEQNCGKCDKECKYGEKCNKGKCEPECKYGEKLCSGKCKNVFGGDTKNCGDCGGKCMYGEKCNKGKCEQQCKYSETLCSGKCMNLYGNDNKNCGGCRISCSYGKTCKSGVCKSSY